MEENRIDNKAVLKQESNKSLIIMVIIAGIFIAGLLTNGFGMFSSNAEAATTTNNQVEFVPLSIGQSPVLGEEDAPVTMYEFSDFSCPFCAAAAGYNQRIIDTLKRSDESWVPPIPSLKKEYIETGKVKLVFKYSSGHGSGQSAHQVGWCLNDQNLFWQFHNKAFENQDDTGNLEKMKSLASELGADMAQLQSCLDSKKYDPLFQKDIAMGTSNGVGGTPSYFINGKLVRGAVSYSELKAAIDKELQ